MSANCAIVREVFPIDSFKKFGSIVRNNVASDWYRVSKPRRRAGIWLAMMLARFLQGLRVCAHSARMWMERLHQPGGKLPGFPPVPVPLQDFSCPRSAESALPVRTLLSAPAMPMSLWNFHSACFIPSRPSVVVAVSACCILV